MGIFTKQPQLGLSPATVVFSRRYVETKGLKLAPQVGLEPTTLRLTAECSTIELLRSSGNLRHAQSLSRFAHIGRLDGDECAEAARTGAQGMQRGHIDARFRQFAHQLGHCAGTVFAVYQKRPLIL